MYLTAIEIENFRSITHASISGLHRGMNVFVGINGAGKSNLCGAILFALMDPCYALKTINRAQILSNDAKKKVGFVKLTIDLEGASVGEFKDQVSITREFTLTTDTFYINSKAVTSEKVTNLLSVLGFNPSSQGYTFATQQSKIASIAISSPATLLSVFTSSTGLWDYDSRKQDAIEKLKTTRDEREEAQHIFNQLRTRCNKLGDRMNRNKEYLGLMAERRVAEYVLAEITYKQSHEQYTRIVEQRKAIIKECDEQRAKIDAIRAEISTISANLAPIELNESIARTLEKSINDYLYVITDSNRYFSSVSSAKTQQSQNQQESMSMKVQSMQAALTEATEKETSVLTDIQKLQTLHGSLCSKIREQKIMLQGQGAKRRASLLEELENISKDLLNAVTERGAIESLLDEVTTKIKNVSQQIDAARAREESINTNSSLIEYNELIEKRQLFNVELSGHIKDLNEVEAKVMHEEYQLAQLIPEFLSLAPANLAAGANLCLTAIKRDKIPGFRGFLAEYINAAVGSYPALESALGSTGIYAMVVEKREVAMEIMRRVKQSAQGTLSGKANFIVIDAVSPPVLREINENCIPLISLVSATEEMKPVIQQALGVSYLTRTLEHAGEYSHKHNIDCYTVAGDSIQGSGVAIGGHRNFKRLRYGVALGISRDSLTKATLKKAQIKAKIDETKAGLHDLTAQMLKVEPIASSLQEDLTLVRADLSSLTGELLHLQKTQTRLSTDAEGIAGRIEALEKTKQNLESVLTTISINSVLSPAETKALKKELIANEEKEQDVVRQIEALETIIKRTTAEKMKAEAGLQSIEASNNYVGNMGLKEQGDLNAWMASLLATLDQMKLDAFQAAVDQEALSPLVIKLSDTQERLKDAIRQKEEIGTLKQLVSKLLATLNELSEMLSSSVLRYREEIVKCRQKISDKEVEVEVINHQLETTAMTFEAMELETNDILQQYKRADSALKEMVAPSPEELDAFNKERDAAKVTDEQERSWLVSYISAKSQQMGEAPPISQHLIDRYEKATKESVQLEKQLADLIEGEHAVEELIENLDRRRKAHFNEQFSLVSAGFTDTFKRITGGDGHLTLSTHGNDEPDGILMEVSFANQTTGVGDFRLSGGQRSLAGLCFILAVEKISNNSLLLLDEPDACLDEAYRAAFTRFLAERVAERTQLIVITFRPEIIKAAEVCFSVSRREDNTSIEPVSNEQALVVAADAAHRESLGI